MKQVVKNALKWSFPTKKPIMTKRYMMTTVVVCVFASGFISDWAIHGIGGLLEDIVIQVGIGGALAFFVYYRKSITRIQELEKELEQKP